MLDSGSGWPCPWTPICNAHPFGLVQVIFLTLLPNLDQLPLKTKRTNLTWAWPSALLNPTCDLWHGRPLYQSFQKWHGNWLVGGKWHIWEAHAKYYFEIFYFKRGSRECKNTFSFFSFMMWSHKQIKIINLTHGVESHTLEMQYPKPSNYHISIQPEFGTSKWTYLLIISAQHMKHMIHFH